MKKASVVQEIAPPREVVRFEEAARKFGLKAMKSPETARQTLRELGIITASGKLSKNFK